MDAVWSVVSLLGGTFVLRPYVVGFLAFFLVAATRDLGRAGALGFLVWGFLVALVAELSSTRVGLPFGLYHYTGRDRGRGAVHPERPVLLAAVVSVPGLCLLLPGPVGPGPGLDREPRGPSPHGRARRACS